MAKKAKETKFFPGSRREMVLSDYGLLSSRSEEKRSKLLFSMPLTGKAILGMPDWIANPWGEMQKEGSHTGRSAIEVVCEGMTMEIFSTEKIRQRVVSSTGTTITALTLAVTGEGDKKDVVLNGAIYVPANKILHDWAWDLIHKTFYASFEYSQSEMEFDGDEDEDDDGLEGDDEDSAPAIAARAKKPFNAKAIQATFN